MNNSIVTQTPHPMIPMTFETNKGQELGSIDVGFLVVCIIFIFLGSCGVLANGRGFCLFFHSSTVKNRLNLIVFNILTSNLLLSSIGIFIDVTGVIAMVENSFRGKLFDRIFCQFQGCFYMTVGMTSMFGTVAFAIVRLVLLIKTEKDFWLAPTKFKLKTITLIKMMWLFSLSFSLPPLFGYGRFSKEMVGINCLPTWSKNKMVEIGYIWYVCIVGGLIPSILMIGSNFYAMKLLGKKEEPEVISSYHQLTLKRYHRRHHLVMMITFIVTWAPFIVTYFLPLVGILEKQSVKTTDVLPILTLKLGCTIMNPLVYVFQESEVPNQEIPTVAVTSPGEEERKLQNDSKRFSV